MSAARRLIMRSAARRQFRELPRPVRLCLGSGHAPIPGWVNVDFEPPADILVDLRYGLPIEAETVDAIYSEHLVEHLTLDAAQRMFGEWRQVLAPRASFGSQRRPRAPDHRLSGRLADAT